MDSVCFKPLFALPGRVDSDLEVLGSFFFVFSASKSAPEVLFFLSFSFSSILLLSSSLRFSLFFSLRLFSLSRPRDSLSLCYFLSSFFLLFSILSLFISLVGSLSLSLFEGSLSLCVLFSILSSLSLSLSLLSNRSILSFPSLLSP